MPLSVKYKDGNDPTWYKILAEKRDEYLINKGKFGTFVRKDEVLTYEQYIQSFVKNPELYNDAHKEGLE